MPKSVLELYQLRYDGKGWLKEADPVFRKAFFTAIKAFLNEAVGHIPLWHGMARGSLLKVAAYVNPKVPGNPVVIPLSPLKGPSRINLGQQLIEFTFKFEAGKYFFSIEPRVEHFRYLDRNAGASPTSPWESFKHGRKAFVRVLKEELKNVPRPKLIKTRVTKGRKI